MTGVHLIGEALGMLSADSLRHSGQARLDVGGAEFNVAVGLARLGHRAAWLGVLGSDELGDRIITSLRGEGVDVSGCVIDDDAPTGLMLKETPVGQLTRVSYYRAGSAGSRLAPAHVRAVRLEGAQVLHLSGVTPALSSSARMAARTAVSQARAAGVTVSLDVNYRARLWPSRQEAVQVLTDLAEQADIVFASEDELDLIATALHAVPEVVITRGGKGSIAEIDGDAYEMPAMNVRVVDTVGAGDAFAAGYLSAHLDGLPPQDRLHRGTILGAFAVSSPSDWQGLPRRRDLDLLDHEDGSTLR